jgi:YhcH/YjgK/YiaL family protein
MKRLLTLITACLMAIGLQAQGYYTQYYGDAKLKAEAEAWLQSGVWRHGFTQASPHETVNAVEFYLQYQKNPAQWKALFEWLAKTDLLALPKGKMPIAGSDLVASVEDDTNRDLDKQRSESHYHHIDFQFVVKGSERFGLIDHYTSTLNCAYTPDVMHYDYDLDKTRFYDSTPDKFFLFFPGDWHIAKLKTDQADQNIRVVVVKVDYR